MALKWKYSCRKNDQKSIFPYSLNIHVSCIIFLMRKEKVCMFDIYFQIAVYIKACVYIYVTCTIENRLTTNKISILDPTCFGYCLHQELYLWCIFSNWYILLKGVYIYVFCIKRESSYSKWNLYFTSNVFRPLSSSGLFSLILIKQ